jgi:hypothetical protein
VGGGEVGKYGEGTGNGRDDVMSRCTHFSQEIAPPPLPSGIVDAKQRDARTV